MKGNMIDNFYVKLYNSRNAFFVEGAHFDSLLKSRIDGDMSLVTLTCLAELVIDTHTDAIVKSRYPLKDIIDGRYSNVVITVKLAE